jgi:L-seryl-tRNA(Ser) seleniumtransferase
LREIPVLRLLSMSLQEITLRGNRLLRKLRPILPPGASAVALAGHSVVGGGSCPDVSLPTMLLALALDQRSASEIEMRLRRQQPAIIARLEDDRVLIDLRTVFPAQEKTLQKGIVEAMS